MLMQRRGATSRLRGREREGEGEKQRGKEAGRQGGRERGKEGERERQAHAQTHSHTHTHTLSLSLTHRRTDTHTHASIHSDEHTFSPPTLQKHERTADLGRLHSASSAGFIIGPLLGGYLGSQFETQQVKGEQTLVRLSPCLCLLICQSRC